MTLEELLIFIRTEDARLKERYKDNALDHEKILLAKTVKLAEEVGELCNEVLLHQALQRKEKLSRPAEAGGECADVLITTLLLAHELGVDIERSLEAKIKKINARYET